MCESKYTSQENKTSVGEILLWGIGILAGLHILINGEIETGYYNDKTGESGSCTASVWDGVDCKHWDEERGQTTPEPTQSLDPPDQIQPSIPYDDIQWSGLDSRNAAFTFLNTNVGADTPVVMECGELQFKDNAGRLFTEVIESHLDNDTRIYGYPQAEFDQLCLDGRITVPPQQ